MSLVVKVPSQKIVSPFKTLKNLLENLDLQSRFKNGMIVAVKLHMGERGNRTHVHPSYISSLVRILKDLGCEPFITDTTTLYPGARSTALGYLKVAAENGFTQATVNAPVIIADGMYGKDGVKIPFKGIKTDETLVGKAFFDVDGFVVVSHGKGHGLAGFGGALKNVAMGFATKKFKKFMHQTVKPSLLYPEKCTGCGWCVKNCGFNAITMVSGKPQIDYEKCTGCGGCFRCPTGALGAAENIFEEFNVRLGESAAAILESFQGKPFLFINVVEKITRYCDCVSNAGEFLAEDVGVYASYDPVAIDAASIQDVEKVLFKAKTLKEVHDVDPWIHLKAAAQAGVGTLQYKLKTIE